MMQNFYMTASLDTPVVVRDGWLTLDAILAALIYQETGDIEAAHSAIPLDRKDGVWCGSAAFFVRSQDGLTNGSCGFGRSLKLADLEIGNFLPVSPRAAFPYYVDQARNETANQWRASLDSYPTISASQAWWFGRGDVARIEALMSGLNAIGAKVNHGWGRVTGKEVVVTDEDYSLVLPDGSPARPIPMDAWERMAGNKPAVSRFERIVPPYWDGSKIECAVPISRKSPFA